jgi:hypothetical protein
VQDLGDELSGAAQRGMKHVDDAHKAARNYVKPAVKQTRKTAARMPSSAASRQSSAASQILSYPIAMIAATTAIGVAIGCTLCVTYFLRDRDR